MEVGQIHKFKVPDDYLSAAPCGAGKNCVNLAVGVQEVA